MKDEPNKVTATLKVVVTGEFYDDETSEETLRYWIEQDLEDAGFDVDVSLLKEQKAKTGHWVSVNDGGVVTIDNDGFPERPCFCSECKKYLIASYEYDVYGKYCPFCGAKMENQ